MYIIEFDLLKNHQEIVADYYKRLDIPRAAKYAKDMIAFYKEVFTLGVNDTLRMYKNDDIRMYNFNCITDTIVEVITTCNTYTLLTVHLL